MTDLAERVLPLLGFLATVVVFAELVARAEVFDLLAARLARLSGGHVPALFALCVALATATTVTLNLDTTAVLLTPVLLALAARVQIPALPLAMTTVWLANTASLLLPVSNLTNLLAAHRVGLSPVGFAARMAGPAAASVLVTAVLLWFLHWRPAFAGVRRFEVPKPHEPADRVLTGVASLAVAGFLGAVLLDAPLYLASGGAAAVVVGAFLVRDRSALRFSLVPVRMLLLVVAMFAAVGGALAAGLDDVLAGLVDGVWGSAAAGAVGANLLNNLPAYLALEHTAAGRDELLALLIGVNVGPLVTPWASLATLIWFQRCRAAGLQVSLRRFVATGLVLSVTATAAAVGGLLLTA